MNISKRRKFSILALMGAFAMSATAAVALLGGEKAIPASADDRKVSYLTTSVFNVDNIRGAEISHYELPDSDNIHYMTFNIGANQTISYRRPLAYTWKTGKTDSDGKYIGGYDVGKFSMELGFANTDFEKFIVRFQSQQYIYADGEIAENYLVFTHDKEGNFQLAIVQDTEKEVAAEDKISVGKLNDRIGIAFGDYYEGEYKIIVSVNGKVVSDSEYVFKNLSENYANYVASGDTAVTPLRFGAEFGDSQSDDAQAQMILFNINGQDFRAYDDDKKGTYENIHDTAAPVLCVNTTINRFQYGANFTFSNTKTIDVIADSPRTTAYYYLLNGDQYAAANYDYDKTNAEWEAEIKDAKEEDKKNIINPYNSYSSIDGSSIKFSRDEKTFVPSKYIDWDKDYNVYGLVKIYYELSDTSPSSSYAKKSNVCLEWYANPEALVNVYEIKEGANTTKTSNFFELTDGGEGITLAPDENKLSAEERKNYTDDAEGYYKSVTVKTLEEAYQKKVDEAIVALTDSDGKLYAGGKNKFFLPSLENLTDGEGKSISFVNTDAYNTLKDYKYSIYYQTSNGTQNSNKNNAFNKLSISLNESNVTYFFKLYITDSFGNPMRYPVTKTVDGNKVVEWEEIDESKIWDEKYDGLLPEFSFQVDYKPATVKSPESMTLAYVGTTFSGVTFEISGVSGTYTTEYELYIVDRSAMYDAMGKVLTREQVLANFQSLFENSYDSSIDTRSMITTVKAASSLVETDPNYELFKDIDWNSSTISFVPQSVDDYYVVRAKLTDKGTNKSVYSYAAVSPSVESTELEGELEEEETWAKNNVTSIVLLSVAGACLLGIVALIVIKPKDKDDIDVMYSNDEQKKAKKASKKASK